MYDTCSKVLNVITTKLEKCQANKLSKQSRKYLFRRKKNQNKINLSSLAKEELKYQYLGSCLILTTFCILVVDDRVRQSTSLCVASESAYLFLKDLDGFVSLAIELTLSPRSYTNKHS